MFVSYMASSRVPPVCGSMTMREYYEAFCVDGRAVLRGTVRCPLTWLARIDGQIYACSAAAMRVRPVRDEDYVPASAVYDQPDGLVH